LRFRKSIGGRSKQVGGWGHRWFRREGRRVFGSLGIAAAGLMAVAALRNMTSAVDAIAAINNVALPLWLIAIGVAFLRDGMSAPQGAAPKAVASLA
jgi:hypothetical protein